MGLAESNAPQVSRRRRDFHDAGSVYPAHFREEAGRRGSGPGRSTAPKGGKAMRMENDMTGKITAILAAAVVLASAGVASGANQPARWRSIASALRQPLLRSRLLGANPRSRLRRPVLTRMLGRCL